LARKTENGLWVVTAKSIHDVAQERGTQKKAAQQRVQYREESAIHATTAAIHKRQACRTAEGIVDLRTGQVVLEPARLSEKSFKRWEDQRLRLALKGFHVVEDDTLNNAIAESDTGRKKEFV
jgi:hypothetical protein